MAEIMKALVLSFYSGRELCFLLLMKVDKNHASEVLENISVFKRSMYCLSEHRWKSSGVSIQWPRKSLLNFKSGLFSDATSF